MALKVVRRELEADLTGWVSRINANAYKIGLFKNDWTPTNTSVIAEVTPANFSGYAGLLPLITWSAGTMLWADPRAIVFHPDVVWTMTAPVITNTIFGYYVVDLVGELQWAERRPGGGVLINGIGQSYTVSPQYSRRSEF